MFVCVAVECSADRQCKWASNGGNLLKVFYEYNAFEGINIFRFISIRIDESIKATCFSISLNLTYFIALLLGSTEYVTIVTYKQFVIKQAASLFLVFIFAIIITIYYKTLRFT